jgi:excisionase family DNA binding protein
VRDRSDHSPFGADRYRTPARAASRWGTDFPGRNHGATQWGRLLIAGPNHPFGSLPQLLTVHEVAEILRLSPRTVRRMIDDERISVVRLGRAVRVRPRR